MLHTWRLGQHIVYRHFVSDGSILRFVYTVGGGVPTADSGRLYPAFSDGRAVWVEVDASGYVIGQTRGTP